jgi:sugar lactone lactonase YvrE
VSVALRKHIYRVAMGSGQTEQVVAAGAVVDGMAINKEGSRLYWTDFHKGAISVTDLSSKHTTTLLRGLDKPRAVVLDEDNK